MEVALRIILLLIVLGAECKREDSLAEKKCTKVTRKPFYNPNYILGKWRAYYTWGVKLNECITVNIKPVSDVTKERFADATRGFLADEPNWYKSELLIVVAKRPAEILMFPDGPVRGRYRGLINPRRYGFYPSSGLDFIKYAIKGFHFFKYLVWLNCNMFGGFLMARTNDTDVSVKEIMALVDEILPGEIGQFACMPVS